MKSAPKFRRQKKAAQFARKILTEFSIVTKPLFYSVLWLLSFLSMSLPFFLCMRELVCLFVFLFVYPPLHLCLSPSRPFVSVSVCLSVHPSVCLSLCLSASLFRSLCLSLSLSPSPLSVSLSLSISLVGYRHFIFFFYF